MLSANNGDGKSPKDKGRKKKSTFIITNMILPTVTNIFLV